MVKLGVRGTCVTSYCAPGEVGSDQGIVLYWPGTSKCSKYFGRVLQSHFQPSLLLTPKAMFIKTEKVFKFHCEGVTES